MKVILFACLAQIIQFSSGASVISFPPWRNVFNGCTIPIPSNRLHAPNVIDQKSQTELVPLQNKENGQWFIKVERDAQIRATCGRGNSIVDHEPYYYLLLTCVVGHEFRDRDDDLLLLPEGLECSNPKKPTPIIYRNGTCSEKGTNFDVEFITETPPRKFYSICMDEDTSGTLYSTSYIDGESLANGLVQGTGSRPDFRGREFYPFEIKQAYKWQTAYEHLSHLLGSEKVDEYFPQEVYRFSRGHLFPNGDGIMRFEKHATFYYLNTVPQWQILNAGNWAIIEHDVRDLAKHFRRKLEVTTGSYGVTTLKDGNNNEVEIWLARDTEGKLRLPVPRFLWKVVHDPVGHGAVAIIQVNNPWTERDLLRNHTLCKEDHCPNLKWLRSREFNSLRRGYTYCCDVKEARRSIPYMPDLEYKEILGQGLGANYNVEDGEGENYEDDANESDSKSNSAQSEEDDNDNDSGIDSGSSDSESGESGSREKITNLKPNSNSRSSSRASLSILESLAHLTI